MDDNKIDELLKGADNRYSIAERYDEWRENDENQANQELENLAKSYGRDELFEEYFIDRVKQLNYLTDKQLLQEAEAFSSICMSEMADGKSLCYSKHYAKITLWREYVDEYCRLYAEVYDYANKQGVKDDPILFASDCAEAYVNGRIPVFHHLKEIYTENWQQKFLLELFDRLVDKIEANNTDIEAHAPLTRKRSQYDETIDMMFPEGIDDGFSMPVE